MRLNVENLNDVFQACLVDVSRVDKAIIVEGVYLLYGFDPDQLEQYRPAIESFLQQLPDELQQDRGGGYSFLNATGTAEGRHWTHLFHHADILFALGMAIRKVQLLTPRPTWHMLPAQMPFYRILA